jgi:hypothetical protein
MKKELSTDSDALLRLLQQVKENYKKPPERKRKRGKQPDYSDFSFLLLAVVAVTTNTFSDSELWRLLSKDSSLRKTVEFERVPHRVTILRRLSSLVQCAEEQIRLLGEVIMKEVNPSQEQSQVGVIDGRMYEAVGPRWHKRDRQNGVIPVGLRNVDVESQWSKSGYRGWVQGYRLILEGLCFPEPVPIWASWSANNFNEAVVACEALEKSELPVLDVLLGDTTFGGEGFQSCYRKAGGGWVLTPNQLSKERRGFKDDLYEYRKETIELLFQRIIQSSDLKKCKVKGEGKNGAFVLASVWLYQVCYLANHRKGKPRTIVKEHLENARWRIKT